MTVNCSACSFTTPALIQNPVEILNEPKGGPFGELRPLLFPDPSELLLINVLGRVSGRS